MTTPFPTQANPITCDADTLSALLVSMLDAPCASNGNGFWTARTAWLIEITAPVLVWARDHKGIPLHMEQIYCASGLRSMSMLATRKLFLVRERGTRRVSEVPVPDVPEALLQPVQAYLGELPGFDPGIPYDAQETMRADQQHSYLTFFLAGICLYGGTAGIKA